jgi:hypothetical protein
LEKRNRELCDEMLAIGYEAWRMYIVLEKEKREEGNTATCCALPYEKLQ